MIFFSEFSSLTNLIYLPVTIYILRTLISLYNLILKRIRRDNASPSYPQKFNSIANLPRRKNTHKKKKINISSKTKAKFANFAPFAPFLAPIMTWFFFFFYRIRENEKNEKKEKKKPDWRKKDSRHPITNRAHSLCSGSVRVCVGATECIHTRCMQPRKAFLFRDERRRRCRISDKHEQHACLRKISGMSVAHTASRSPQFLI